MTTATTAELTNAQADRLAAMRHQWDGVTGYMMPADHRHSPSILIVSAASYAGRGEYVAACVRIHPDGRREAITDPLNHQHFLHDARTEGRRI